VPADPGAARQTPPFSDRRRPPATPSACEPYRATIEGRASRGQPAQVIWQDLVDEHGFTAGYDSVKRFVRKLKAKSAEVFAVIPTEPGLEAQVDYGRGAPTIHPQTGKYRRPWLFSMKLSHSRKAFRKVVWTSSSRIWCELHEEGFRHFGGAPRIVKLDNLKEGVIRPDIYDPELNPLYAAMLAHYGVVASPCRVATPRHKGKSESDIKYAQNTLKGRRFERIEDQQTFLDHWDRRWASTRIHGVIKRQVNEVFDSEERAALLPLPPTNFPILQIVTRKVHSDGHIKVDNAYYSAPSAWVHREVTVHVGRCFVDLFDPHRGERLARHLLSPKGRYQTDPGHLPESKRLDHLHERLIRKAEAVGPHTATLVTEVLRQQPYHAIRQAQGILSFTRTHPAAILENAARQCVERGLFTYRGIKQLIAHAKAEAASASPELTQYHPLIRTTAAYQDLWSTIVHDEQKGNAPC
jgi:transposase